MLLRAIPTAHGSKQWYAATCGASFSARPEREGRVVGEVAARQAIWFQTGNDDKDPDTGVNVSVQDQDAAEVASGSVPYGGFPDGYTSPAFPLQVIEESTYDAISDGQMAITINPNGHYTWIFDAHLRLRFSHHTHIVASATNVTLTQDHMTTVVSLASPT